MAVSSVKPVKISGGKIEAKPNTGEVKNIVSVEGNQTLYAPPSAPEIHEVTIDDIKSPEVIYGPPPVEEFNIEELPTFEEVKETEVIYGPPPAPEIQTLEGVSGSTRMVDPDVKLIEEIKEAEVIYGPTPAPEIQANEGSTESESTQTFEEVQETEVIYGPPPAPVSGSNEHK